MKKSMHLTTVVLLSALLLVLATKVAMAKSLSAMVKMFYYERVINQKNLAAIDHHRFFAIDIIDHNPFPGQVPGLEGLKKSLAMLFTAFPDLHLTVENIIKQGKMVTAQITMRGTHQGEFMGIAPTGKQVKVKGVEMFRFGDRQFVERWGGFDLLSLMQQLGVIPPIPSIPPNLGERNQIVAQKQVNLNLKESQPPSPLPKRIASPHNGHQYEIVPALMSWKEAKAYAEKLGGYLATITSKGEQEWVYQNFGQYRFWLGGSDEVKEGEWSWATGEKWEYTNWGIGEPNNMGGEDALEMTVYGWNDLPIGLVSYPDSLLVEFDGEKSPRNVVATFFSTIYLKEYGIAYGYLSSDTKKLFEPIGGSRKFGEMMSKEFLHLDLGLIREEIVDSNSALVFCRLLEDPASMGFKLVKEKGEWRLILGLSMDGLEIRYPSPEFQVDNPFLILKGASSIPQPDAVKSITGGQVTDGHNIEDIQVQTENEITYLRLTFTPEVIPHYEIKMQDPHSLILDFSGARWASFFRKQKYPWNPNNTLTSMICLLPVDDDSQVLVKVVLTRPVRIRVKELPELRQLVIELKPADELVPTQPSVGRIANPHNGHQYEIVQGRMSWREAKARAKSLGGYLATITSQQEQDWIYQHFWQYRFWLGGSDEVREGEWQWVTGEKWEYSNWGPDSPNDMSGEDALEVQLWQGTWNDLPINSASYPDSLLVEFDVKYQGYEEQQGKEYQQFFPPLRSGEGWYWTRMKGVGNVDNAPEKEEVVLITVQEHTNWDYRQAFLLVCTRKNESLEKKYLLEIFNNQKQEFTEGQFPPYVFHKFKEGWKWYPDHGKLELVDLNKDGILDVFVQLWRTGGSASPFYVVAASFQDGSLKRVFSSHGVIRDYPVKYADLDEDGVFEILIPDEIIIGFEHASDPIWISCYEWDENGKEYRLNNQKFYSRDADILMQFLHLYSYRLQWYIDGGQKMKMYLEGYEFYLGLIYYYRGNFYAARNYFLRIVEKSKNENYIREAQVILKQLTETGNPDFAPQPKN